MKELYENPLITRYAGKEMAQNFSDDKRFKLFRKLWVILAECEKECGLNISDEQIEDLKKYQDDINFEDAEKFESQVRHEVMAQIKAYGKQATKASGIIHLGATSCYVLDNADIMIISDALNLVEKKLANVVWNLKNFALKYKDLPTLGFTHFQPAQLTTVGKRASLWLQDFLYDLTEMEHLISTIRLRGIKGTTGTQASFLDLFDGDIKKIKKLEKLFIAKTGYSKVYAVTGQTYPRKFDYQVLSQLSSIAQSANKFANDIRLLQGLKEIEEPFEKNQIGSSAMAYKRNPMRCERICSLARFVTSLPINCAITSSNQWFERTLDDSANKRIVIAQAFLTIDGILNLMLNVSDNLVVYDKIIAKHIQEELPFMATENIIMEGVKSGGNRQELHEKIRVLSMTAGEHVKKQGKANDLIELIKNDKDFASIKDIIDDIILPEKFIGLAPIQVEDFVREEVEPILKKYKDCLGIKGIVNC